MKREDLSDVKEQWCSWAPFVRSDSIPLDRKPLPPLQSIRPGTWAPFMSCKEIPPGGKPLVEVAPGPSHRSYGPYSWSIQHVDGPAGVPSDSDLKTWAAENLGQTKPEDVLDDSAARLSWLGLKRQGKSNAHLDAIMSIIGPQLEPIKEHFLSIWERYASPSIDKVVPPKFFNLALKGSDKNIKHKIAYLYALFLQSIGVVELKRSEQELSFAKKGGMKASSSTVILLLLPQDEEIDSPCHKSAYMFTFETTLSVPEYNKRDFGDLRSLVARMKEAMGISIESTDEELVIDCLARQAAKTPSPLFDDANNVVRVINKACEKMKARDSLGAVPKHQEHARRHWEKAARQLEGGKSPQGRVLGSHSESMAKASDSAEPVSRLTLEEVVGPPIPDLKADNKPWQQLQSMTGLDKIKQEFAQMIDYAQRKKESERLGIEMPRTFSLHRLFLGPPGVGKTTVAKLYGQLILDLGLVSGSRPDEESEMYERYYGISRRSSVNVHKEPSMVDPSHLIGAYVGHSERNTSKYLSKAKGGVLVIDEAHMLYTSRANGENCSDVFRRAVLDKIVAEVTADADEDRCVILVGHPDRMEDMFLHSTPGLQRRFPKETAMIFGAFTSDQLLQIFRAKMEVEKIQATEDALKVAEQVLVRMRINPQFGNAGDVENLLATARRRHLANNAHPSFWANSSAKTLELEPQDIDPRWNRLLSADGSRAAMFEKFVGFESISDRFEQYKNRVVGMERRGVDPRPKMPWNFVFEGPPGTGKTSTARKLGQLYYDLCLLSTDEVIECSVGELLDMTGLKVTNMLEKSLGKVLFIDEAYRLVGTTAGELITGELVDAVTKTRYARNLVIVLAGYTKEMDKLLSTNPGLRSRFPERIQFPLLSGEACKELLEKELRRESMFIEDHVGGGSCGVVREFRRLSRTPGWANGRDVEALGRSIVNAIFAEVGRASSGGEASDTVTVSRREVDKQMRLMYEDRTRDGQEAKSTNTGQARWGDWHAE